MRAINGQIRKLLSTIAHEAHIMGRIYTKMGEVEQPAEVYKQIESMIDWKVGTWKNSQKTSIIGKLAHLLRILGLRKPKTKLENSVEK